MTDPYRDFSCSTISSITSINTSSGNIDLESSSLDSYSNLFDKAQHDFTTSSEISFINLDNEPFEKNPLSKVDHNRTFTKEISKTIINAFTGKPISGSPWSKLCTKNIQQQKQIDDSVPIHGFSLDPQINQDKIIPDDQFHRQIVPRQSRRDLINNQRAMDNTNDKDDQAFEQFLEEHRNSTDIKLQRNTPLKQQRKKRNSFRDCDDDSSTSSDERLKEHSIDLDRKINRTIDNDSLWHRLADVYTSDDSDENNHLLKSNISYSIRLKSDIDTSNPSSSTNTSTQLTTTTDNPKPYFNFLESLSERISIEDKHPDAKSYFVPSGFNPKGKRQALADKLLSIFDEDVFSSQLSDKVSVVWSGRLTATAGHCTTRKNTRTAVITLSLKVCDSPERCRDTLLHEMCHAAVTLIDGVMEHGHGPLWRKWTRITEECYPYLPLISVRHTYDVIYKFVYRCGRCQYEVFRHSKSLNLAVDFCGKCMGEFRLITNNNKDAVVPQERQTPKKTINKYNLYIKENFQITKRANPHLSTPQLMKQLSQQYKKKNQQQQECIDLPDFEQLRI